MRKVLFAVACLALAGCSGFAVLAGTGDGFRAFNDGQVGLVEQGKATPDVKTAYWDHRNKETAVSFKGGAAK
jgi:hypothetical protein